MTDPQQLQIAEAKLEDAGEHMLLTLRYVNPTDTTLHVYAVPRAIFYDPDTNELTVRMTDQGIAEPLLPPPVVLPPKLVAVDPHDEREIVVKLPRFVNRIEAGEDRRKPVLIQLPAYEATTVNVEVAWSDKPFYRDPRGKGKSMREQTETWQRGTAKTRGGRAGQSKTE
jgi:hypothetical protein